MAKVTTNPLARGAMRFWDSGNFESLLAVSAALKDDERCVELAEYCRLREKGLRAAAFTALAKFIERTEKYDRDERIDLSDKILELAVRFSGAHQFLSEPLRVNFLLPCIKDWLRFEPNSPVALRWDGWINGNISSLERAMRLDPNDNFVRRLLIDREYLSILEHATHHIDESILLIDISEVDETIRKAEALLQTAPDPTLFVVLASELAELKHTISDWKAFQNSGAVCFSTWRRNLSQ